MLLLGIVGFILFAIFALLYLESFWSNTITLMNVTLAALLALNSFERAADAIEGMGDWFKTCTYLWDYLMLWLLFCIYFAILRAATDFASRTRVKFRPPIEIPGRMVMALMVGLMMVAFILVSFHVSPLPAAPFSGGFASTPTSNTFIFSKPDHSLLGFMQKVSKGALAGSNEAGFDPNSEFILKYHQRRADLEKTDGLRVNTGS